MIVFKKLAVIVAKWIAKEIYGIFIKKFSIRQNHCELPTVDCRLYLYFSV